MALKGASKYCNTVAPGTGTPTTVVGVGSNPTPISSQAFQPVIVPVEVTTLFSGSATSDTYRCMVLPAGFIVADVVAEVLTTCTAGTVTLGLLATGAALNDGGTAGTADALVTNSNMMTTLSMTSAAMTRRTLTIPADASTAATKAASPGIAVPYDRMIGFVTPTAHTVTNGLVKFYITMIQG